MAEEERTGSSLFSKMQKECEEYDTLKEDCRIIKDPEEAKEHIANNFESLYQTREGKQEYAEWTELIKSKNNVIEEGLKKAP